MPRRRHTKADPPFEKSGLAPACFLSAVDKSVLPVAPVEKAARPHLGRIEIVEAAGVDAEILRIGAGNVEGVDAAMAAEGVLRDAGIEAIGGEIVMAAQQFELPGRDANVKDALLGADLAVAFAHGRLLQIDADAKPHPAAMAAALVCLQHFATPYSHAYDALPGRLSFWGRPAHNPAHRLTGWCRIRTSLPTLVSNAFGSLVDHLQRRLKEGFADILEA